MSQIGKCGYLKIQAKSALMIWTKILVLYNIMEIFYKKDRYFWGINKKIIVCYTKCREKDIYLIELNKNLLLALT